MLIEITYNVTDVYMSTTETPVYVEISFEQPGGSAAVWGSITGTLSNQTDLQNALNAKVPYTGATGNVDLGEYELKAGQVEFDQTPTGTAGVGVMRWNDTDGTVDLGLKGGNVTLQVGQEQVARVVNKTGANLLESEYKVVKVTSAQGQRLAVDLAQANNDNNSADTLGIVTENIDNNQEGFITTMGTIRGINTTGSLQGETWTDGDVLYLSGTTAGAITNVKPTAPLHIVVVGYVEYAHANNGKIYVKVMNGWELDELHNVSIVTPTDNQGLFYNATSTLWENKSITTALGYTPVPTTRNITINGVTYDLSVDRTYTISTGISGSGASGQVTYWTGASAVSGSNNLFWDAANSRLGIGTNVPTSALHVTSTTWNSTQPFISLINLDPQGAESKGLFVQAGALSASSYIANFANYSGTSFFYLDGTGNLGINNTSPSYRLDVNGVARFQNQIRFANNLWMVSDEGSNRLQFATSSSSIYGSPVGHIWRTASDVTIMSLFSNGNLALGQTSDSGQRLQVIGDTLLRGSGNTSATTALTVQNSDSTAMMQLLNNGYLRLGSGGTSAVRIYPTDTTGDVELSGLSLAFNSRITSQSTVANIGMVMINGLNGSSTSGAQVVFLVNKGFAPTSGTGTYVNTQISPVINQTGGANGITRGLYVNPTLTAAADWRSIEWSNNSGWGLYGAGTAANYLGGRLQIGGTTVQNYINLWLSRNISGFSFSYGIVQDGIVQSDVITAAFGFTNSMRFAASVTTPSYSHFYAEQGNIGAGVTITNQFGFRAHESMTGATNNYGFYGNIASGTGRWNIYMNGTADNYLAGNLGIGITPTVRLHVSGDTILRGSGATSATTALTVQNSSSTELFSVRNDGSVNIPIINFPANGIIKYTTGNYRLQEFYDGATASNSFLVAHPSSGSFNFGFGPSTAASVAGTSLFNFIISRTGVFLRDTLSTSTSPNASSVLELSSTTRGFLPPRMTTTQKNAIATPAAGLVVYDTTDNKHYGYDGTTWNAFY